MSRLQSRFRTFRELVKVKAPLWAPNLLQICALGLIVAGFWVIALPAGLITAGLLLGVVGWAVDSR